MTTRKQPAIIRPRMSGSPCTADGIESRSSIGRQESPDRRTSSRQRHTTNRALSEMTALPAVRDGLRISQHDRALLARWSRSRTLAARVVLRSRIVLMLADGYGVKAVAERLGVAPATVRLWRRRFGASGPEGLLRDAAGRGRKPLLDSETRRRLREESGVGADAPLRERARALGVSVSTVSRWRRSD